MKLSDEEIRRRIDENVTAADACNLIHSLVECLYGEESDEDWGADTLDSIAGLLQHYNLTPDE